MTDPTLVISIDHTGVAGAIAPLVFYAAPGTGNYGITRFREPAMEPVTVYADRAGNQHGEVATEWAYADILHDFDFVTDEAASEAVSRGQIATVRAFLGRLRYAMTITVAGAPPETWVCKPGSLVPVKDRERPDLVDSNPVWNVTIPAHPIRSV